MSASTQTTLALAKCERIARDLETFGSYPVDAPDRATGELEALQLRYVTVLAALGAELIEDMDNGRDVAATLEAMRIHVRGE